MQLKENTLYRMRDGRVVGPLTVEGAHAVWFGNTYPHQTLALFPQWKINGRWDAFMEGLIGNDPKFDIVEEVQPNSTMSKIVASLWGWKM